MLLFRLHRFSALSNAVVRQFSAISGHNVNRNLQLAQSRFIHTSRRCYLGENPPVQKTGVHLLTNQPKRLKRRRSLTAMARRDVDHRPQIIGAALAENFDLDAVMADVHLTNMYLVTLVDDEFENALHLTLRDHYRIKNEPRDFFVFDDGVVVAWRYSPVDFQHLVELLAPFRLNPYEDSLVQQEVESMAFEVGSDQVAVHSDLIQLPKAEDPTTETLNRYAISQGMAASVKVAIWEHRLNEYAEPMNKITQTLKKGSINVGRKESLQRIGEFAALRYSINLNAGLLNTDFYWEREDLEKLYQRVNVYFMIRKRLRELNSRLDYCENLASNVDNMLTHRHASFLEWMIIVLIVIEVIFDLLHYFDFSVTPVFIVDDPFKKKSERE